MIQGSFGIDKEEMKKMASESCGFTVLKTTTRQKKGLNRSIDQSTPHFCE